LARLFARRARIVALGIAIAAATDGFPSWKAVNLGDGFRWECSVFDGDKSQRRPSGEWTIVDRVLASGFASGFDPSPDDLRLDTELRDWLSMGFCGPERSFQSSTRDIGP
jgi:hypothetical protein